MTVRLGARTFSAFVGQALQFLSVNNMPSLRDTDETHKLLLITASSVRQKLTKTILFEIQ